MTRQLSEIAEKMEGVQFRLTSLNPINPKNKATSREEKILQEFEYGLKDKGMFVKEDSENTFFYMAPLMTQKSCLACHSKQGYTIGDVRGAISITLPFNPRIPWYSLSLIHISLALLGVLGIMYAGKNLKEAYDTIEKQALFDALTDIPNRQYFLDIADREFNRSIRNKEPLSMIICDIDNFKIFNDTYGHSEGDQCLKRVAQGIKSSLSRSGDCCARYGGEEFVIVLPNTDLIGAKMIAEKIRSNIEKMQIPNEKSLPAKVVTLSLGIAAINNATRLKSWEDLIKHADLALYKAKDQGRNQVQTYFEIV